MIEFINPKNKQLSRWQYCLLEDIKNKHEFFKKIHIDRKCIHYHNSNTGEIIKANLIKEENVIYYFEIE